MLSGDVAQPILDADSLMVKEGLIAEIGKGPWRAGGGRSDRRRRGRVCPGLIDSHCHVVLGDYTPRQQMQNFLDSTGSRRSDHSDFGR